MRGSRAAKGRNVTTTQTEPHSTAQAASHRPAGVLLEGVSKVYDKGVVAVADVTLEIADGEFMVLVGPSGCGKSTPSERLPASRR